MTIQLLNDFVCKDLMYNTLNDHAAATAATTTTLPP